MTERIDALLAQLTLEEKAELTSGVDMWHTPEIERLGVPALKMTDGPVGARGAHNTGGPPSACFPCGTALAATWDVALVEEVGRELGLETRAKGAHVHLAPTVNTHRSPLAGRNFECFSEDPHLTARMAVAYISGVQSTGVGSCIKHLVANDSEFERFTISSEVPERALREIYLRPFEVAVAEAEPVAVMAAYNKLSGTWCSEHPWLLGDVLRGEWGYDGLVVSDWWATHTTVDAAVAGLDLEMPGPPLHRGALLVDAVRSGDLDEAVVERCARRVLEAMERTGAFELAATVERSDDTAGRRDVARRAASSAIVLLKNESATLPLDRQALRRVAVIGPNADALNILGGGSAAVSPYYAVTPLEGLRAALGDKIEVVHEPGCSITRYPPPVDLRWVTSASGDPGIDVEVVAGDDPDSDLVLDRHVTRRSALSWAGRGHTGPWAARLAATFTAPVSGRFVFQGGSTGLFRIRIDGETVVDGWNPADAGRPRRVEGGVELVAGERYELRCDYISTSDRRGTGGEGLELRCQAPLPEDSFERAVSAAAAADVAVVVVGTNGDWETEGRDRKTMDLPGRQRELIEAVAAVNPRAVVVVNAGAPVTMDWVDSVPAVLQSWFLGQETGNAIADVLFGAVDASGRLPTTIPRSLRDTPAFTSYPGEFGKVHYGEGLFVGYRWYDRRGIEPRFPFGHGLSYTTFSYAPLRVVEPRGTARAAVELAVTNTGSRSGAEVVQVYVSDPEATVARPDKELVAFRKVLLGPGETALLHVDLDDSAFAFWSPTLGGWQVEPGEFVVMAAASAGDVRQKVRIVLDG